MKPVLYNWWLFFRGLRAYGFEVSYHDMERVMNALVLAKPGTLSQFYEILGTCLVRTVEQQRLLAYLFAAFIGSLAGVDVSSSEESPWLLGLAPPDPHPRQVSWWGTNSTPTTHSARATIFSHAGRASSDDQIAAQRLVDDIPGTLQMKKLAAHQYYSHRRQSASHGRYWNTSKTLRKGLAQGEIMRLWHRRRVWRERLTLILWDTSRSMESVTPTMFQFLHELVHQKRRVEILSFSTRITRVTQPLRYRDTLDALTAIYETAHDIHGGTRIADALEATVHQYSRWLSQRTDVLLLTDGFESGNLDSLAVYADAVRRRCRRLFWGNPWDSRPGFSYASHSLKILKDHVDGVIAAGTVEELTGAWNAIE